MDKSLNLRSTGGWGGAKDGFASKRDDRGKPFLPPAAAAADDERGRPHRDKGKKVNVFRQVCASFQRWGTDLRGLRKDVLNSRGRRADRRKGTIAFDQFMTTMERLLEE